MLIHFTHVENLSSIQQYGLKCSRDAREVCAKVGLNRTGSKDSVVQFHDLRGESSEVLSNVLLEYSEFGQIRAVVLDESLRNEPHFVDLDQVRIEAGTSFIRNAFESWWRQPCLSPNRIVEFLSLGDLYLRFQSNSSE